MLAAAGPASAADLHPAENYGFGPDGTPNSIFATEPCCEYFSGKVRAPVFEQSKERLFAIRVDGCCGPSTLTGFTYNGPGSVEPLAGFPVPMANAAFGGVQMAIDESGGPANGTIYLAMSGTPLGALTPEGIPKQGVSFEPEAGYKAGAVAVGPEGHVFGANNGKHQIEEFAPTGGKPLRVISVANYTTSEIYALAIDQQTGDLFVRFYNSTYRLTKEANYEDKDALHIETAGGGTLAIDSSAGVLYAPNNSRWSAYDLNSGSLLEERSGTGNSWEETVSGMAVDEATHTLFTGNSAEEVWQLEEWRPVGIADVTTGGPTGNATVSGSVDPAGAGTITECKFEYVPASAFNEVQEVAVSGATGGTYKLYNYADNTYSEPIPYNATLAEFKQAVEPNWGAGNVSVTGPDGGPYTVEFTGALANTNPGNFYAEKSGLTPSSATVTVTTKRNGGASEAWNAASTVPCAPAAPINASTGVSGELTGVTDETTYHYRLVAVDSIGKAVGGERTITPHRVKALMTEPADEIARTGARLHGSYEGTGEAIHWWFEWGTAPSSLSESSAAEEETTTGQASVSTLAEGLTANEIYFYRVSAENEAHEVSHGEISKFKTLPAVQSLETKPATEVKPHTAELNASFVGDGTETEYFYEWGTTEHYGSSTAPETTEAAGLESLAPAELTGLVLETVYHYRVVAKNSLGTTYGADRTFKTLPAVAGLEPKPVTELESHSATINGAFTGNGDNTTYHYSWGESTGYGNTSPPMQSSATGITQLTPYHLTGLEPEVTYHFQIVAENSEGVTKSADATFTTPPAVRGLKTLPASEIGQESIQLNAEFAGNGQDTHYYFEYGTTTSYGRQTAVPPGLDAESPTGVKMLSATITDYLAYTTYHYRVVAVNAEGETRGNDETFETLPALLPDIRGTQATGISPTAATLKAEIDPRRWNTVYLFEYGTTPAYGDFTELNPQPIGNDHTFHAVQEAISELEPGTVYHFRVVAINYTGTQFGPDETFATPGPPAVDLATVRGMTATSAHLVALVNPNSTGTTVRFEYGTSAGYGVATGPIDVGSSRSDREAAVDIGGLAPSTTYHFRVVAENANGNVASRDQTFTTPQAAPETNHKVLHCKKPLVKRHGRCVRKHRKHRKHHGHRKRHRNSNHRIG